MANIKFQNALKRIPQKVPPIWFMRQAGRYHSHYQKIRAQHSFIEMCKDAELAAEVAMGPILDFDFDVAILFSDLLFPLEAMGMGLSYEPAPTLGWHLNSETIKNLRPVSESLSGVEFQKKAVMRTRERLPQTKSLIGFVGGPWTLFAYAVEGAHKGGLEITKQNVSLYPKFCEVLLPLLKANIQLQLDAGCEVVMIFDTAAGEASPRFYQEVVVPELEKLMVEFKGRLGYYAKGVQPAHLKHKIFQEGHQWAGLGYDHRWNLSEILLQTKTGFVQGNFDQALLFLPENDFAVWVQKYLEPLRQLSIEERCGWVSGLGHGVLPKTPEKNVRKLIQSIREVLA